MLIALVILLFLQNGRAVLIAVVAIPMSFAIILLVLYVTGQTLNAFTLGGLTLAMGPLVDISVVMLESIHRQPARWASDTGRAAALRSEGGGGPRPGRDLDHRRGAAPGRCFWPAWRRSCSRRSR